ncbi:MAG: platelet-activating factor acetylhydrolase IB subunit [Planctomycetota bacterium]
MRLFSLASLEIAVSFGSRRAFAAKLLLGLAILPGIVISAPRLMAQEATGTAAKADGKAEVKLHSAIKPEPRDGNWMKRHESFNNRVKQGNVDLLFIGDSITQGWEGAGKAAWAERYAKRNAVNLGIGGDRTQHVLWRLDNGNIEGIKPKAAVLMIGSNNSGSNTPEEIADGIKAIVAKLRTKLPDTKILVLAVFPRGADDKDARRQVNVKTNALVAPLADDKHVFYLDIGPKFLGADGSLSKEIMPDLLHLSPAGYKIWADSIESHVEKLMGS